MRLAQAETPHAALAQLVEHRIRNAGVVGSNPIGGTIFTIKMIILQIFVCLYKSSIHPLIHLLKLAALQPVFVGNRCQPVHRHDGFTRRFVSEHSV